MRRNLPPFLKQNFLKPILALIVGLFFFESITQAAIKTWVPTTGGAWTTAANWSPSGVPATGDDVIIDSDQSANITAVPSRTLASLIVSGNCRLVGSTNPSLLTITNTFSVSASVTLNLGNSTNGSRVNVTLSNTCSGIIDGTVYLRSANTNMVFTNSGSLSISSTGLIVDPGGSANSNFILDSGATLGIGSTAGITSGTTASGNIQVTGTRSYSVGANYVYEGTASQNTGNGLPSGITGHLTINNTGSAGNNIVTLNSAESTANGGSIDIIAGIFAAGTNLTLGTTSTINRSGGSMTGTPTGTGVYDVIYTGNSMTTATELAGSGLRNITVNLAAGQALTLDANRVLDGNLSIVTGTFDLSTFTMNRSAAGGILTVSNGATLLLAGTTGGRGNSNFPNNFSTNTLNASSVVEYNGIGSTVQTIYSAVTYGDLVLTNGAATGTATKNLMANIIGIAGDLTINSNTLFDLSTFSANRSSAGGTLTVAGTLLLGGTSGGQSGSNFPTNFTTLTMTGGTVNYDNASGGQTIYSTPTYTTLTMGNTSGTQTAGGNLTTNILNNNSNAANVLNMGTYTLAVTTPNNTGTIRTQNTSGTPISTGKTWGGTVTFDASTAQTIPASAFNNLTLANAGGATLSGTTSVSGIFTLSNGILTTTGTNLLSVTNVATSAISGGSTNSFIKGPVKWSLATGTYLFPVGKSTGNYFPFTLTTSAAATPVITVEAFDTDAGAGATFDETLASISHTEYWHAILNSGTFTGKISLTRINPVTTGQVIGKSTLQGGSYTSIEGTISGSSIVNSDDISTLGYFVVAAKKPHTYYSYQSGDWKLANTWTTDPSGSFWVNGGVPSAIDDVVILNGRTITINEGGKSVNSLEIKLGGTLDLLATTTHNFGTVAGEGVLKLASNNFPGGVYTNFVAATGGTVEYNNASNFTLPSSQTVYNNLVLNLSAAGIVGSVTMSNLTVNGNFTVTQGIFKIGQDAAYTSDGRIVIDFKKNVTVASSGSITVGTATTNNTYLPGTFTGRPFSSGSNIPPTGYEAGALVPRYYDIYHKVYIGGSLINNGSVKFISSAITIPNYTTLTTSGAATVRFYGMNNSALTCYGTTDFYNLIVDKGSDQTYVLTVDASAKDKFRLFGRNDWGGGGGDASNPELDKALWIKNGTLRLIGSVTIPSLSEGSCAGGDPNSDFYIPLNGALIIDGPDVTVLSTADSYREVNAAYGMNETGNTYNINTTGGCSSFSIYGKFEMNNGFMSTRESGGFIFWYNANGVFILNGGFVDAKQLRTAGGVDGVASYIQTGGTLQLRGRYTTNLSGISSTITQIREAPVNYSVTTTDGLNGGFGTFNVNNVENMFSMTGSGVINILDVCQDNGLAFEVKSKTQNNTVTGGTVNIITRNNTGYYVSSTAPIQNMNLSRFSGSATVYQSTPLVINNALTLSSNSILNAQNNNITVGGNFTLNSGCTYVCGTNTTTFNGNGPQLFTNAGTITASANGLNNFILSNASNTSITNDLTVNGLLTINNGCTLNDQGFTINVKNNIINSGLHTSQANGSILLNGTTAQTVGGSGSGVFGNFGVNKTSGTANFTVNQSIIGNLRLVGGILDIGSFNLKFSSSSSIYDALTGTAAPSTFGDSKMIKTTGDQSDGGITKTFSTTGSFLFPVGTSSYHPATISFSQAPAQWGDVTVKPVAKVHPSVDPLYEALTYYWKVTSNSITGIQPGSVSHTYHYNTSDATTDNQYITGVYNPFSWTKGATEQVDIIGKNIYFPSVQILDGEYTAGLPNAFGAVKVYYSHASGDWSSASTWSNVSNADATNAATPPGPNDLVVIGDGGSNNHVVTMSANNKAVGGLQLSTGSTLDLKTTTGHNFGTVTGSATGAGTLRISSSVSSAVFPSGDFGNFLGPNGGTVEYYTETAPGNIGVAFTLPTSYLVGSTPVSISNYNNLVLSPATGKNITLPNSNLLIYKNLTISVSGTSATGIAQLNNQNTTRTLTVNGNLNINNGNFQFTNGNNTAQNVAVVGNVTVASGATFDVAANLAATNTLSIQGDLTNNGIFDMIAGASQVCNVTFAGAASKQIKGTTATRTDFNILTVNKGTDRTSVIEATVNALTLNTALASAMTITNGTFRLSSNLPITLTTSSPFTIPPTGCLSANIGTINICTANNNAADLLLQGRLELINAGIVHVGGGLGSNNDIEIGTSGTPEINVSGGTLTVDGQIRRNEINTQGALIFNQSGGLITVKGKSFDSTRGMFELLNNGSQFNVSGGNLVIETAGSTSYADVLINAESSVVNGSNGGHTLTIGNSSTAAAQTFSLNSSVALWNLTVDGTTNNKTASLSVNALSVLNNLTINSNGAAGTGSVFKANELNVTIGGSLINNNLSSATGVAAGGYQAGAAGSTQNTTFTGTGTITGTGSNLTNFANLVIGSLSTTPSITLSSNSSLRVNTNLILTSGTISDAGNTITVIGNINNSATHSSPLSPGGGILLTNSVKQVITTSGNGKLGNITINNASGVDVIGDSWITGQLKLTLGSLYINDYKLVMDVNSSFGGTYDVNRMVTLNGAVSDKGVEKYFAGSTSNFIFPIGSTGKYRPVTYTFTSSNAGSITIIPVNEAHPSDFAPTTDQLNYYWKTTITGFSGANAITQVYQYGATEVTGTESSYLGARFSNYVWTTYAAGSVDPSTHTITVNDLFTGDYTAGQAANFGVIHKLYSKSTGNWTDNIWAEDSPSNPLCGYYPNGNPVFIQPGHTITMNINSASATSVDIQGTFDLKQSSFHNLGAITDTLHAGTGKMRIQATSDGMFLFPGGNYDRFMASTGTTVELYGDIDAQMPLKPGNISKPYQNLILTGTGIKYMSAETLKILGNLTINNGAKLSDVLFNKELYILGNWTDLNTSPATGFVPGTGIVSFEGNVPQTLTVTNSGVTENYYNFQINNPNGVTILGGGNVQVSNNLSLVSGAITTNTTNSLTLTNSSTSVVTGGSVTSYVNGPLRKQISNGSFFTFPVGKASPSPRYGQIYLSGVVTSGIWQAEYFNNNPNSNSPSLTITSMLTPVASVSNNEYWLVKGVSSGSANATLRWDANSGYHSSTPDDRSKIRVVEWNPSGTPRWESRGNIVTDNGADAGLVTTDSPIALAAGTDLHYLTIGSGNLPLPTATITSSLTASFCNNSTASTTVTVALTGTAPWSLTYKLGSVSTTINNIVSSPVSIVLTSTSSGITQPITTDTNFNFNITNVNDFNGVAGISDYAKTMVLTVHPIPDNTITGKTLVGTGEVVAYSTPADANTYTWTVSANGTITSGAGTNSINITWGTGSPGPYTVGLTKNTTAGCQVTGTLSVTTSTTPTPVITGNQKVCAGSVEVYSTPFVSGHSYTWTVSANGTITSGAGTNNIAITWGSVSINNIVTVKEYVTATPSIFTNATKTVDIGIQPSATTPSFVAPSAVCINSAPSFTINNSELYVRYQLRNNSDNSNSGLFVDGTGGTITLTGSAITAATTYNIYAYTLAPFDCGVQLSNPALTATVNVTPTVGTPVFTLGATSTRCAGAGTVAYTATATNNTGFTYTLDAASITGGNSIVAGTGAVTYVAGWSGTSTISVIAAGCNGPSSAATHTVTITPTVGTPTAITISAGVEPTCQLTNGTTTTTYATTATNNTGFNWSLSNGAAGSIGATTGVMTWANGFSGSVDIRVTANGCNGPSSQVTRTVTITPTVGTPTAITVSAGVEPTCQLTNGTTTTTYATTATNNTGFNWSLSNGAAGSIGATTGVMTWANGFSGSVNIRVTANGCNGPSSQVTRTVTITPTVGTPTAITVSAGVEPTCQLTNGTTTTTYATTATNNTGFNWSLSNGAAGSIGATTGVMTWANGFSGSVDIRVTANGCNGPSSQVIRSVTIITLPSATINYVGNPLCSNLGIVSVSRTGTAGGAYSAPAGLTIDSGTGAITTSTSTPGNYTVTYTMLAGGGCGIVTTTCPVAIKLDGSWNGSASSDWNTTSNWECNQLPTLASDVIIANGLPNYPTLSSGSTGKSKNLSIQSGSSVTVSNNTLEIAGAIVNNGTFTATAGTIEMKGSAAQNIPANAFATNTIKNLTINNSAGVTLQGTLNVTGIVKAATGNLASGGNLTLISSATQTALIDGSGSGNVTGNVTMQRYLPSAFGYKYFSSPFQAATVSDFSAYVDLPATFPPFYKYDEDNHRDSLGINVYQSGWVKYLSGTLAPMAGYSANFGAETAAKTVNISGTVSNGSMLVPLSNHNRKYTKGFNLVGNPYPSPIDWKATSGWTKTNIDDAIYFFNAGNTNQYTGVYSSYVNGVSSDGGVTNSLITSMQGFFVHVSDPVSPDPYPITGILGFTNSIRTNDLDLSFKDAIFDNRTILRFTASFETKNAIEDAAVIYLDEISTPRFDKDLDALKITNTDLLIPNLYTISSDLQQLSINGLPALADSITKIPLGVLTLSDGWVDIAAKDIERLPSTIYIYLVDAEKGVTQNLKQNPKYRVYLKAGEYNQRFTLIFSLAAIDQTETTPDVKLFSVGRSANLLLVKLNLPLNSKGRLMVTNMAGQQLLIKEVSGTEMVEINPSAGSGVYVVTVLSGRSVQSEKILIRKDYE